jgi:membrane protein involved in colicin uptake
MTKRKRLGILLLIAVTAVCLCSMKTSHESWLSGMHKRESRKISASVVLSSYRPAQKHQVQSIIGHADDRIKKTDSLSNAEKIRKSALAQIQSIKTDAQLTKEEKAAKEKARKRRLAKEKAKKRAEKRRAQKTAKTASPAGARAGSETSSAAHSSVNSGLNSSTSSRSYSSSARTGSSSSYSGHSGSTGGSSHTGHSGNSGSKGNSGQSNGSSSKGCVGDDASNFY